MTTTEDLHTILNDNASSCAGVELEQPLRDSSHQFTAKKSALDRSEIRDDAARCASLQRKFGKWANAKFETTLFNLFEDVKAEVLSLQLHLARVPSHAAL